MRVLKSARPPMRGEDVERVQNEINRFRHAADLPVDGSYGPFTQAEVAEWKYRMGWERPQIDGALTVWAQEVMFGGRKLPPKYRARRIARMKLGFRRGWGVSQRTWKIRKAPKTPPGLPTIRMISRSDAGLRSPRSRTNANHARGVGHVVHWQGPGRGAVGLLACFAQLRGFQNYHMDGHGWSDIGYSYAIPRGAPAGTVIELRGRNVHGAHSGHNVANAQPGVLVMLGQDDDGPTPDQLATLKALAKREGWGRCTGHNEWSPTSCPGPDLTPWVKANR